MIYQLFITILPIILIPYISRTLTEVGTGIYAYTHSLVLYFSNIGLLGVRLYGNKMIASSKNVSEETKLFWEIFIMKAISCLCAIVLYIFFALFIFKDNQMLMWINGIWLLANLVDISWYFVGKENFKNIVIRNSIVKIISFALVLIFVKSINDLWKYALIMVGLEFVGQVIMWIDMRRIIKKRIQLTAFKPFTHLKGMISLFIPQLVIQVYTIMNITMLGSILDDPAQTGFFDMSSKIVNMLLMIVTALGTVMMPRISRLHTNDNQTEISNLLMESTRVLLYVAIPISAGLLMISDYFVPWFFGNSYNPMVPVLLIYCLKIPIVVLTNVMGTQYLIPTGRDKLFTYSVLAGAIVNIIFNFLLIRNYGAIGAAISTLITEIVICLFLYAFCYKKLPSLGKTIISEWRTIIAAGIMFLMLSLTKTVLYENIMLYVGLFIETIFIKELMAILSLVVLGILIYVVINFVLGSTVQKRIVKKIIELVKVEK